MLKNKIKALSIEIALRLAIVNVRVFGGFDKEFYLNSNEDVASGKQDPVRHYLAHGCMEGRQIQSQRAGESQTAETSAENLEKLLFVRLYNRVLRLTNPHLGNEHWENVRIISKSGLFDSRYYLESNKDVLESNSDPLLHFVAFGYKEGRNPCPGFDMVAHAIQYGIPSHSNINPFVHYISQLHSNVESHLPDTSKENLDHSIVFDANYYLKKYPDLVNKNIDAFEHFLSHGLYEGRDADPSPGGYAQWRSNFVTGPGRMEMARPVTNSKITLCLLIEAQSSDEITRTIESLLTQQEDYGLAVVGKPENAEGFLDALNASRQITSTNIYSFTSLSELFQNLAKENDFFSFLTVGDQLIPGAIREVKTAIDMYPEALLHYSDEEIVDLQDILIRPSFKGAFDPDLQRAKDYIGNFLTLSAKLAATCVVSELQTWSGKRFLLVNHIIDQLENNNVNHIPQILYRRNMPDKWPQTDLEDIAEFIRDSAKSQSSSLARVIPNSGHSLRLEYKIPATVNHVSIIMPTRNGIDVLKPCIESILKKTDYPSYELVIIDNGSDEKSALDYLDLLNAQHSNITVIRHDEPFNYSELNNIGVESASGEYFAFLNNDVEVINADWLNELVSQATRPEIGVVGALLLFPDGTIQHAGVAVGVGGVAAHSFSGWDPDSSEFEEYNHLRRVSAVTGACMVMRREVFEKAGGFDEDNLPVDFNDVDFCMRVSESGLGILFTPHARLYHYESKTRVSHKDNTEEAERFSLEVQWMQERWFARLTNDPFYSPNYSLGLPGYNLAWPPRIDKPANRRPDIPNLDLYATHSNPYRAESIAKTMGRTPSTLSKLTYELKDRRPGLSVIILNLDKPEFIVPLIESMRDAEDYFGDKGFSFEILIGDTGSTDLKVLDMYESAPSFVKISYGLKYQFSRCNNQVFAQLSSCNTVLFLNNDIEFSGIAAKTLFEMFEFLNGTPDAGAVGAQLLFPDKSIQHAGIGVFESGSLRGFVYHPDAGNAAYPKDAFPRKMWAVTGACLMMKSSDFAAVNGFDEAYRTECQDAALCMEMRRRGLQSYVLAPNEITHFENGTREKGSEDWPDRQRFMRQWGGWIDMELRELVQ